MSTRNRSKSLTGLSLGWDVLALGAKGDGLAGSAAQDTAALQLAIAKAGRGGTVLLPQPPAFYQINAQILLDRTSDYVRFLGLNTALVTNPNSLGGAISSGDGKGERVGAPLVRKVFNGDLFKVQAIGVEFDHITVDTGASAGYTGMAITVDTPADYLGLFRCGFYNWGTYAVSFGVAGSGSFAEIAFCRFQDTAGGGTAGIQFPAATENNVGNSGKRRVLGNFAFNYLVEVGGCTDSEFIGNHGIPIFNNANSVKNVFSGNRIPLAGQGAMDVNGTDHIFGDNTINGGNVTLNVASNGIKWGVNGVAQGFTVTDNAARGNNFVLANLMNGQGGVGGYWVRSNGQSTVLGIAALGTTATDGFAYLPTCAGPPTGVPTTQTGTAPLVLDSTNNKLYVYLNGAWKGVVLA